MPFSQNKDAYEALIQFLYQTPIGLVEIGLDGSIAMLNPMSAQLLMPLSRDGGLANLFDLLDDVEPGLRAMASAHTGRSGIVCESLRVELPGGPRPRALSISLLKLDERRLMAALSDVTVDVERERQGLAQSLSDAARTDTLTGMANRTVVIEHLQRALAAADAGTPFAVLFMNCDRLMRVNESIGHAAGDQILSLMAQRLRSSLRRPDERNERAAAEPLVARVGGDEFVLVLDDLRRPDDVHAVAQRLVDLLSQPYGIGQVQVSCPVSMGVVVSAQSGGDADTVLQDATIAMAEAKRAGGARYVVFSPPMRAQAVQRGAIEVGLRQALAVGELFIVYQPVVGLQGSAIDRSAGVEALVRWRHPERGVVLPLEFIGIAEECGLIGAIGDFVLATACADFVRWQRELPEQAPRLLAVNLSRAQVGPGSASAVQEALRASGMAAAQLQLEVTESLAAQDETVRDGLHDLKALGVRLALDDFGTGYSSLASLHLLPVDTVKIDRSFVSQVTTSRHHRALVEATVRVAHSLDMDTVAEGIETEAQAELVKSLGCAKGQGYLFSRPLAEPALREWLLGDGVASRGGIAGQLKAA